MSDTQQLIVASSATCESMTMDSVRYSSSKNIQRVELEMPRHSTHGGDFPLRRLLGTIYARLWGVFSNPTMAFTSPITLPFCAFLSPVTRAFPVMSSSPLPNIVGLATRSPWL